MAQDHDLEVAVQIVGGAREQPDRPAQQQIREGQEHRTNLPGDEGRPDPTNALTVGTISCLCALQPTWTRLSKARLNALSWSKGVGLISSEWRSTDERLVRCRFRRCGLQQRAPRTARDPISRAARLLDWFSPRSENHR